MKNYNISVRDVHISDPYVLADTKSKKYYVYSSNFNIRNLKSSRKKNCFYVIESPDLINWSEPILVFDPDADFWGPNDYWAPECHIWKGKYYIFSSFRGEKTYRRCQALVSDSPLGPFKPIRNEAVTPEGWQCLDASLYVDKQGKPWMLFCHEWTQVQDGQIAAIQLSDDLGEATGPPIILFRASDAPWREDRLGYMPEQGMTWISGFITDGCYAHRMQDGSLIMLWSNYSRHGYAVGYARSLSGEIQGPWEQEPIPLYVMDGGHAMLFKRFDGQLMMSFHAPNHPHSAKRMLLFEVEEQGSKLVTLNEITGNWYSIDKAKEPKGYYTYDPETPPTMTKYGKIEPVSPKKEDEVNEKDKKLNK
jgi:beta-xylosidase